MLRVGTKLSCSRCSPNLICNGKELFVSNHIILHAVHSKCDTVMETGMKLTAMDRRGCLQMLDFRESQLTDSILHYISTVRPHEAAEPATFVLSRSLHFFGGPYMYWGLFIIIITSSYHTLHYTTYEGVK
jgi:hypothetical protein